MAKKILSTIISLVVVAAIVFGVLRYLDKAGAGNKPEGVYDPYVITLETPANMHFSDGNFTLYWDEVEHATSYLISHNGVEENVGKSTLKIIIPVEGENVFRVKALGDGIIYSDSAWSQKATYTYQPANAEKTVYETVRDKMMSVSEEMGMDFVRVVGISWVSLKGSGIGKNIIFQTVWVNSEGKDKGKEKNVEMGFSVDGAETIPEILSNLGQAELLTAAKYPTVSYNTAQKLVDSGAYVGYMKELKDKGYTISVVDSAVREGKRVNDDFRYDLVGTYRAELGDEVIYFSTVYNVNITSITNNAKYNYEEYLTISKFREITEASLVIHIADTTLCYIADWAERY